MAHVLRTLSTAAEDGHRPGWRAPARARKSAPPSFSPPRHRRCVAPAGADAIERLSWRWVSPPGTQRPEIVLGSRPDGPGGMGLAEGSRNCPQSSWPSPPRAGVRALPPGASRRPAAVPSAHRRRDIVGRCRRRGRPGATSRRCTGHLPGARRPSMPRRQDALPC